MRLKSQPRARSQMSVHISNHVVGCGWHCGGMALPALLAEAKLVYCDLEKKWANFQDTFPLGTKSCLPWERVRVWSEGISLQFALGNRAGKLCQLPVAGLAGHHLSKDDTDSKTLNFLSLNSICLTVGLLSQPVQNSLMGFTHYKQYPFTPLSSFVKTGKYYVHSWTLPNQIYWWCVSFFFPFCNSRSPFS